MNKLHIYGKYNKENYKGVNTMTGFLVKLIASPIALIIADMLFYQINYPSIYYPIFIGILIAIIGYALETAILKRGTLWISTAVDFVVATLTVYVVSKLLPGTTITFFGAVLASLILGLAEHVQHIWLINSGRVKNSGQKI